MFTLVYINKQFNRPDTLLPFLQSNVGKAPLIQIDCITPFTGSELDLIQNVCYHLNQVDYKFEVKYVSTINCSIETYNEVKHIIFIVLQIEVKTR